MRNLKPLLKMFICFFTVLICIFSQMLVLSQFTKTEENIKQNYDYSKIKEYQGKVLYTNYEYIGDSHSKYVYIELENGKTISIGIGGADSPKENEIVTVYTDDDNNYEFNKDAVAVGYSGFGWFMLGTLIMIIPTIIGGLCFGWKGALTCFFIMMMVMLGSEE